MVNYSKSTRNELISVCKSRNIKNVSNKKKDELIKIIKKGGYNSTNLKRFEKLLLIVYGIDSSECKSIDIKLDYREIIYLNLIRFALNYSKNIEKEDELSKEFYKKIDEIEDYEVKLFIYIFVKTNICKIKYNITHTLNIPSSIYKNKELKFSNDFNEISEFKDINKFFDKLSELTNEQKKCFQYIINAFEYKKFNELDLNNQHLKNFNFNIGMLTPFNLSIYGNFYDKFIEKCGSDNNNFIKDLINFKPKTDELSLNSLGFAIFVGNYKAVEYLLEKGADFRNVFDSRFVKDNILNTKYSQDAITFTLLLYYSIIKEDSSIILSRLMYYESVNNSQNRIKIKNQKINFIKRVINLILPKFQEKSNVNLLGYKDKKYTGKKYTVRSLLKKHDFKNKKSVDILEKLKNETLPENVKININTFYEKINDQKKKIKKKSLL